MSRRSYQFEYDFFSSADALQPEDAVLLKKAWEASGQAYAPYSHFKVGAAARLANGIILSGSNQENASFPAGICAERVLLSSISVNYPGISIETLAISFSGHNVKSDHPISPCGICRQSLQEYETRFQKSIRLILGGFSGDVYVIPTSGMLLPFSFTGTDLNIR